MAGKKLEMVNIYLHKFTRYLSHKERKRWEALQLNYTVAFKGDMRLKSHMLFFSSIRCIVVGYQDKKLREQWEETSNACELGKKKGPHNIYNIIEYLVVLSISFPCEVSVYFYLGPTRPILCSLFPASAPSLPLLTSQFFFFFVFPFLDYQGDPLPKHILLLLNPINLCYE